MIKKNISRIAIGFALTALFLAHNQNIVPISLLDRLELLAYDARLNATVPERARDPRIVIIDIDERSLNEQGHWPWNRVKLANLVNILFDEYQIDTLGFDVVFAERDSAEELELLENLATEKGDQSFINAYQRYKPQLNADTIFANALKNRQVVLGYYFDIGNTRATFTGDIGEPLFAKGSGFYDKLKLPRDQNGDEITIKSLTGNVPELQAAAAGSGFYSIPSQDKDGVLRRIQLLAKYDGAIYESLALSIARTYVLGDVVLNTSLDENQNDTVDGFDFGMGDIPIDSLGSTFITYKGRVRVNNENNFRYISASDILKRSVKNPEDLEYAIAIVGTTAAGLIDLRSTPMQNNYPGVEIQAITVASLLDADFRSSPYFSTAASFVMLLVVGVLLSILLPYFGLAGQLIIWLATSGILIAGNLYFWIAENTVLIIAPVLSLAFLLMLLNLIYGYFFESRNKAKLSGLFGQYIPPQLVDEMAKDPDLYSLEAQKKEMTVLFSDVRSFTTISEGLDPQTLADWMNQVLTPMTSAVHHNGGTIDKYMGDAMMAFWGAPIEDKNHADHALDAAFEMLDNLAEVNKTMRANNLPEVRIGVGVNTGDMSVGNMGSEFRVAYTVLGDAVNLGSRVEGLSKSYGVEIVVTQFTAEQSSVYEYRQLDKVRVKGKDEPVTILEPIHPNSDSGNKIKSDLAQYNSGIAAYQAQEFEKALAIFSSLKQDAASATLYKLYIERCQQFIAEPPASNWDGVFTFTSK